MERTLLLVKPDAVQRRLVGPILSRIEAKGLAIVAMKLLRLSQAQAEKLYEVHRGKKFYEGLLRFITSGPVVALAVEGAQAIRVCRKLMGATFGPEAEPGTIRGDFGSSNSFNLIHGSDSSETAERERGIFFKKEDFVMYDAALAGWMYDPAEEKDR